MSRQLYPILLSITIALAIGIYMQPGEARKLIQQASQWGGEVLSDTLRATRTLADELGRDSQSGYASTSPAASLYPPSSQDPTWTYVADGNGPPASSTAPPNGNSPNPAAQPSWAGGANQPYSSSVGNPTVYPRVLADGSNPGQPRYPGQTVSPNPATNGSRSASNGASPYATTEANPLRPNMPREAPWATAPNGSNGMLSTNPPASSGTGYQNAQPKPRVGAAYPKVQWAGDWRDYRGVPETVKPMDQSQYGYLPPPNIDSTVATVDRYLPTGTTGQTPAAGGASPQASQPLSSGSSVAASNIPAYGPTQGGGFGAAPNQQARLPVQPTPGMASQSYGGPPLPSARSGQPPAAPYQQPPYVTTTPGPQGYGPSQALAPGRQTQQPSTSYVTSVPQRPAYPSVTPRSPSENTTVSRGVQMETPDPVADLMLCEGAQVIAIAGDELVLANELLPLVNETLSTVKGIEEASESDLAIAREQLIRKMLPQRIDMKLLYVDAKRNLPPEAIKNISERLKKSFEEEEVSKRIEKLGLSSRRELEEKLMMWGTSLEQEKRAFVERTISQMWGSEKLRRDEKVTHEELLDYYHAHATEYEHPTRVRWEHLEITFARHSNKREAWQLMAEMGNAVQQGRPFAEVAKERSEGVRASGGGQRDWLTQGSLKSDVLDRNLFSLAVGAMSPILEDETGFHILRVVERENAYRTPFEEIQGEIREKIKKEHEEARLKEFVETLREEIPVWTIFDKQTADSGVTGADSGRRF